KLKGLVNKASTFGPVRRLLAGQMRKQTRRKAKPEHYPAPYRLIDAFEAHGDSKTAMIRAEANNIPELLIGETSTNLRRVFRLMESLKDQGKKSDFRARRVHVIGAGVMGGDIAAWCAMRGLEVTLQDREMKYVEPALKRAKSLFRKKLKTPVAVDAATARLRADIEGEGVRRADVVIEAIFENREAKRELLAGLKDKLQRHAIVATNTSAIPLGELSDVLDEPGRLIGLHFFNPVAKMPLVEIVHDTSTDADRVNDGSSFATQIGKYALPATSTPGFLVNRVLVPYMYTAMTMHRDGIPKEALDKAAVQFGMPMGPVELVDTVGLDVGLDVIDTLLGDAAGEDRKVLEAMVESGKKGKKTSEGFYKWENGKPVRDDEAHKGHDLDRIARDLIQPYLDECLACLRDGVVENEELLDAGMIFGTGFAPFRGGPVHYIHHGEGNASADDSLLDRARAGKPIKSAPSPAPEPAKPAPEPSPEPDQPAAAKSEPTPASTPESGSGEAHSKPKPAPKPKSASGQTPGDSVDDASAPDADKSGGAKKAARKKSGGKKRGKKKKKTASGGKRAAATVKSVEKPAAADSTATDSEPSADADSDPKPRPEDRTE
ncbi:MAG: 3-hydroxyacyl-CoA dehydrogenase family protein, partial [Wenzhouxiangellaceae bacterium]